MNATIPKNADLNRKGLTLVELLVVLTILAIMTLVAVQSTEYLVDQGRYDATQQSLQNVQNAVLGPVNQANADTTSLTQGFIADVGRPPLAVANASSDASQYLAELWSNPLGLPVFASYGPSSLTPIMTANLTSATPAIPMPPLTTATPPVMTAQVQVMAGWRGPYLNLPAGTNQVFDGWGSPFTLYSFLQGGSLTQPGTTLTQTVPYQIGQTSGILPANMVSCVQSHGGPTAPYQGQLATQSSFTNYNSTVVTSVPGLTAMVSGTVSTPTGVSPASPVYILLFYPDMTQSPVPVNMAWASVYQTNASMYGGGNGIVKGTGSAGNGFTFSGVPVGPRVLLAYQPGGNQVIQYIRVPAGALPVTINSNFQ